MSVLEALFQGLIQGFTEFLPVSSSGHLSLFQHFFGINGENAVAVTLVLHMGTLIAVFAAFRKKIIKLIKEFFRMVKTIFSGKFRLKKAPPEQKMIIMLIVSLLPLLVFYIFKDQFSSLASDGSIIAEGIGFLYTAALLFLSTGKACSSGTHTCGQLTARAAGFIGVFQGIALIPGVSRSGSTISAGLLMGLKKEEAVEYSFILGIPVILAGSLVELKDMGGAAESIGALPLIICFITAAIAGYFAICLIKLLVVSDRFRVFAYYTLALGIIVLCVGIYEAATGNVITFKPVQDTAHAFLSYEL